MKLNGLLMMAMTSVWVAGARAEEMPSAEVEALAVAHRTGVKQMKEGKADEAKASFEAVIRDASASKESLAEPVLADAANDLGTLLLAQGKDAEAEAMFRKAIAINPVHAVAGNNLGLALSYQGRIKEALAAYERSVRTDPTLGSAANNLSRLLIQAGEDKKAAGLLAQNLKISKDGLHEAFLLTAGILCRAKVDTAKQDVVWDALFDETDKSLAAREKLLNELMLNGADTLALRKTEEGLAANSKWTAGLAFKARLTARVGKTLDALKQFRTLVRNDPKDASLRSDLIELLIEKGLLDEAKEQSEAAVKAFPENSALWFAHGKTLESLGDDKAAEKSYRAATNFGKSNWQAWNGLAALAEKQGDIPTALACYGAALECDIRNTQTLFKFGRLHVAQNTDFKKGVKMLMAAAGGGGSDAKEAGKLLERLRADGKMKQ